MTSGIIEIIIGVLAIILIVKVGKSLAKCLFYFLIGVGIFMLIKGVGDWAFIETVGLSVFEWIGSHISGDGADVISNSTAGTAMFSSLLI